MVTHDTRLIDKCDRIFMMEDGVLKEKNNQKQVENGPSIQQRYTAKF